MIFYLGSGTDPGRVVRIGQGNIAERLASHRLDAEIVKYKNKGLLVTWAKVHSAHQSGVEKYLAEKWPPLVGVRFPASIPIQVNSPFE